jgi:RimJ/RimL family protein N-acetyltransferase
MKEIVPHSIAAPTIFPVSKIIGANIRLRNVARSDASFILSLRTDPDKSAFLSKTPDDLRAQEIWIEKYISGHGQAYFIIENSNTLPIGTVRIYDAIETSFCWGSWILADSAPSSAAIESALIIYTYCLDYLGFTSAHFEVDRRNTSVWKFHERFGAVRSQETQIEYVYKIGEQKIRESLCRFRRYLPNGIQLST